MICREVDSLSVYRYIDQALSVLEHNKLQSMFQQTTPAQSICSEPLRGVTVRWTGNTHPQVQAHDYFSLFVHLSVLEFLVPGIIAQEGS